MNDNPDDLPPEMPPEEISGDEALLDPPPRSSKKASKALLPMPSYPDELYILPLNRRPFFPGMAAPIVIEPGIYYEVLKIVA